MFYRQASARVKRIITSEEELRSCVGAECKIEASTTFKISPEKLYVCVSGLHGSVMNDNGDYFDWDDELLSRNASSNGYVYETWRGTPNCLNHNEFQRVGTVVDVFPIFAEKSIDFLLAVDKKPKNEWLIRGIKDGRYVETSMGCLVASSKCSRCGNIAYDLKTQCDCLRYYKGQKHPDDGEMVYEINKGVEGLELSWITQGVAADSKATARGVIARREDMKGHIPAIAGNKPEEAALATATTIDRSELKAVMVDALGEHRKAEQKTKSSGNGLDMAKGSTIKIREAVVGIGHIAGRKKGFTEIAPGDYRITSRNEEEDLLSLQAIASNGELDNSTEFEVEEAKLVDNAISVFVAEGSKKVSVNAVVQAIKEGKISVKDINKAMRKKGESVTDENLNPERGSTVTDEDMNPNKGATVTDEEMNPNGGGLSGSDGKASISPGTQEKGLHAPKVHARRVRAGEDEDKDKKESEEKPEEDDKPKDEPKDKPEDKPEPPKIEPEEKEDDLEDGPKEEDKEEGPKEPIEEIAEEVEEIVEPSIKEEIKEVVKGPIKEEIKEEVKEEISQEVKEESKEEIKKDIKQEIVEEITQEFSGGVQDKKKAFRLIRKGKKPLLKLRISAAFRGEEADKYALFSSKAYGEAVVTEIKQNGVKKTIAKHFPRRIAEEDIFISDEAEEKVLEPEADDSSTQDLVIGLLAPVIASEDSNFDVDDITESLAGIFTEEESKVAFKNALEAKVNEEKDKDKEDVEEPAGEPSVDVVDLEGQVEALRKENWNLKQSIRLREKSRAALETFTVMEKAGMVETTRDELLRKGVLSSSVESEYRKAKKEKILELMKYKTEALEDLKKTARRLASKGGEKVEENLLDFDPSGNTGEAKSEGARFSRILS